MAEPAKINPLGFPVFGIRFDSLLVAAATVYVVYALVTAQTIVPHLY